MTSFSEIRLANNKLSGLDKQLDMYFAGIGVTGKLHLTTTNTGVIRLIENATPDGEISVAEMTTLQNTIDVIKGVLNLERSKPRGSLSTNLNAAIATELAKGSYTNVLRLDTTQVGLLLNDLPKLIQSQVKQNQAITPNGKPIITGGVKIKSLAELKNKIEAFRDYLGTISESALPMVGIFANDRYLNPLIGTTLDALKADVARLKTNLNKTGLDAIPFTSKALNSTKLFEEILTPRNSGNLQTRASDAEIKLLELIVRGPEALEKMEQKAKETREKTYRGILTSGEIPYLRKAYNLDDLDLLFDALDRNDTTKIDLWDIGSWDKKFKEQLTAYEAQYGEADSSTFTAKLDAANRAQAAASAYTLPGFPTVSSVPKAQAAVLAAAAASAAILYNSSTPVIALLTVDTAYTRISVAAKSIAYSDAKDPPTAPTKTTGEIITADLESVLNQAIGDATGSASFDIAAVTRGLTLADNDTAATIKTKLSNYSDPNTQIAIATAITIREAALKAKTTAETNAVNAGAAASPTVVRETAILNAKQIIATAISTAVTNAANAAKTSLSTSLNNLNIPVYAKAVIDAAQTEGSSGVTSGILTRIQSLAGSTQTDIDKQTVKTVNNRRFTEIFQSLYAEHNLEEVTTPSNNLSKTYTITSAGVTKVYQNKKSWTDDELNNRASNSQLQDLASLFLALNDTRITGGASYLSRPSYRADGKVVDPTGQQVGTGEAARRAELHDELNYYAGLLNAGMKSSDIPAAYKFIKEAGLDLAERSRRKQQIIDELTKPQ